MYGKRDLGIFLRVSEQEKLEFETAAERHNMTCQALIRFVMRKALKLDTPCELEVPVLAQAAND